MLKQSFTLVTRAAKEHKQVWLYLALVILLELIEIGGLYKLNIIRGDLYEAIQQYKPHQIWVAVGQFTGYAMVMVLTGGYLGWLGNRLSFAIRTGLTSFYLGVLDTVTASNRGQRVQEDLRNFGDQSCTFWLAVFRAGLKLPIFVALIIGLTKWYIGLGVVVAVLGGTYLTKVVANRLVKLQAIQEGNEATFRQELSVFHFANITKIFHRINSQLKWLSFTQSGLGQIFVLLPFMLLLPLYISKELNLGTFFRAVDALGKVIDSLSVLIDNRQILVNIQSTLARLQDLDKGI